MKKSLTDYLLRRKYAVEVLEEQNFEAQRLAVEHQAAAEHHQALATMYAARVQRTAEQLEQKAVAA